MQTRKNIVRVEIKNKQKKRSDPTSKRAEKYRNIHAAGKSVNGHVGAARRSTLRHLLSLGGHVASQSLFSTSLSTC